MRLKLHSDLFNKRPGPTSLGKAVVFHTETGSLGLPLSLPTYHGPLIKPECGSITAEQATVVSV